MNTIEARRGQNKEQIENPKLTFGQFHGRDKASLLAIEAATSRLSQIATMLVGPDDSLDILNTAWIRVAERFTRMTEEDFAEHDGNVFPYLYRAVINGTIDHFRRIRRREKHEDTEDDLSARTDAHDMQEAVIVSFEDAELRKKLKAIIKNEDIATAFLLAEFDGYSYQETADIQGVPLGTIRSRVHRARNKARRAYQRGQLAS